jgi:hypothetical protein
VGAGLDLARRQSASTINTASDVNGCTVSTAPTTRHVEPSSTDVHSRIARLSTRAPIDRDKL